MRCCLRSVAVFIASWESNPVERTVVSCVMVCVVCGRHRSPKGKGTLAQSTGGDSLARARRILSDGRGTTRKGSFGGVGGWQSRRSSENVTSLDTKEYNNIDSINKS